MHCFPSSIRCWAAVAWNMMIMMITAGGSNVTVYVYEDGPDIAVEYFGRWDNLTALGPPRSDTFPTGFLVLTPVNVGVIGAEYFDAYWSVNLTQDSRIANHTLVPHVLRGGTTNTRHTLAYGRGSVGPAGHCIYRFGTAIHGWQHRVVSLSFVSNLLSHSSLLPFQSPASQLLT